MYLEIKILNNIEIVKKHLKEISTFYQEDFLIEDIVFVKISNLKDLDKVSKYISFKGEQFAYLMEKENNNYE